MPEVMTVTNAVDMFSQQLIRGKDWSVLNAPLWNAIDEMTEPEVVSERGVRIYFWKNQPGGHSNPTANSPDVNRYVPGQSDSMWAVPQPYMIPVVIDWQLLNDAGGDNSPKKANAMVSIQDILKQTSQVAFQRQEYYACGNGSGALAYASASLTVVGAGQALTCETAAAAAPGHTKGAVRLKQNQYYQSFDTTTGLPEGTILVTSANNKTQATVTLLNGVVTSGNPICDIGAYNGVPMGFTGLIDNNNRIIQGRDSSVDTLLNCQTVDLSGNKFTVTDRETLKTLMVDQQIDDNARSGLTNVTTPGLMSDLRKQGLGFRRSATDDPVADISKVYKDADGTRIMEIPSFDEDRSTFYKGAIQKHTQIPLGEVDPDGLNWRNLPGVNATGSRTFYRMWGTVWTLALISPFPVATVKRASLSGITTQVVTGAGN